jgi:hypothetical protein
MLAAGKVCMRLESLPPSHVLLHVKECLEADSPGLPWRRLEHVATKFLVEYRSHLVAATFLVSLKLEAGYAKELLELTLAARY